MQLPVDPFSSNGSDSDKRKVNTVNNLNTELYG